MRWQERARTDMLPKFARAGLSHYAHKCTFRKFVGLPSLLAIVMLASGLPKAQEVPETIDDMTAKYHFLTADDTLAILDEEGKLKGYIEVTQPENESDDILTFDIVDGSRKGSRVVFRTNKIHGKYYRFSGTVERGKGHEQKDPDYFRLTGDLDIVTVNSDTGQEKPQAVRVMLKSFGASERSED